jgi:hypothetical protein
MLARCQYGLSHCFSSKLFFFDELEDGDIKLLQNLINKLPISNFTHTCICRFGLSPNPQLPYIMQQIFPATYSLSAIRKRKQTFSQNLCNKLSVHNSHPTDLLQLSPNQLFPSIMQPVLPGIYSSWTYLKMQAARSSETSIKLYE